MSLNEEKTKTIVRTLVEAASAGYTITYGQLRDVPGVGGHCLGLRYYLGEIGKKCKAFNDLPPLPALVINKKTRQPGEGIFIALYSEYSNISPAEKRQKIADEQARVFAQNTWGDLLQFYGIEF